MRAGRRGLRFGRAATGGVSRALVTSVPAVDKPACRGGSRRRSRPSVWRAFGCPQPWSGRSLIAFRWGFGRLWRRSGGGRKAGRGMRDERLEVRASREVTESASTLTPSPSPPCSFDAGRGGRSAARRGQFSVRFELSGVCLPFSPELYETADRSVGPLVRRSKVSQKQAGGSPSLFASYRRCFDKTLCRAIGDQGFLAYSWAGSQLSISKRSGNHQVWVRRSPSGFSRKGPRTTKSSVGCYSPLERCSSSQVPNSWN